MKELKVGDYVWLFDGNHRVYPRDKDGRAYGGPIYREHWRKTQIEGETVRSWLVSWDRKLPKGGKYITSEEELDKEVYVHDNAHEIARRVQSCHDYGTLKAIEELLN